MQQYKESVADLRGRGAVGDGDYRRIGDVAVAVLSKADALRQLTAAIDSGKSSVWGFCNAHTVNLARTDATFRRALAGMTMLNDGVGVDLASRLLYQQAFPDNLNGTDFTPALLDALARPTRIFLLGSAPGIAERAAAVIARDHSNITIVGTRDGFFPQDAGAGIAAMIAATTPDLVLLGMGQPRQELWATSHAADIDAVLLCVGALLDFTAGAVSRAPAPVRAARLEWAYRLAIEPRRLARRYLIGNATFVAAMLRDQLSRRSEDGQR